jgi:hypothetical protein
MQEVKVVLPHSFCQRLYEEGKIDWVDRKLIFDKKPANYVLYKGELIIAQLEKDGSVTITKYHVKEICVRGRLKLPRVITL